MDRVLLDEFHLVPVALLRVAQPAPDDRAIHAGDRDVVQRRRARTFCCFFLTAISNGQMPNPNQSLRKSSQGKHGLCRGSL
jgi:hypothetical protein